MASQGLTWFAVSNRGCVARLCIFMVVVLLWTWPFGRSSSECNMGDTFDAVVERMGHPKEVWPESRRTRAMWVFDDRLGANRLFVDFEDGIVVQIERRTR